MSSKLVKVDRENREMVKADHATGMLARFNSFIEAWRNPTKRVGQNKHVANPDFIAPAPKICNRFEQLDTTDEPGVSVSHTSPGYNRAASVHISVEDPEEED